MLREKTQINCQRFEKNQTFLLVGLVDELHRERGMRLKKALRLKPNRTISSCLPWDQRPQPGCSLVVWCAEWELIKMQVSPLRTLWGPAKRLKAHSVLPHSNITSNSWWHDHEALCTVCFRSGFLSRYFNLYPTLERCGHWMIYLIFTENNHKK